MRMMIIIDGITADVTFENEKTLGDALSGIEKWVDESGFCLSRVSVDGVDTEARDMDAIFARNIDDIKSLDIVTRPFAAFYGEALFELIKTLNSWREDTGKRRIIEAEYKKSPSYSFLAEHDKELLKLLYGGYLNCSFSDEAVEKTLSMAQARSLETENPVAAFLELENKLNAESEKLLDLPLDLQTGNDRRAARTVEDFSNVTQNMLRLLPSLQYAMLKKADVFSDSILFDEFKSALKEFAEAYENKDMVLSGDLAEYELAPRVKERYAALKKKLSAQEFNNV
jgi:hypothetical protein